MGIGLRLFQTASSTYRKGEMTRTVWVAVSPLYHVGADLTVSDGRDRR